MIPLQPPIVLLQPPIIPAQPPAFQGQPLMLQPTVPPVMLDNPVMDREQELALLRARIRQLEEANAPVAGALFAPPEAIEHAKVMALQAWEDGKKAPLPEIIPGFKADVLDICEYTPHYLYCWQLGCIIVVIIVISTWCGHTTWGPSCELFSLYHSSPKLWVAGTHCDPMCPFRIATSHHFVYLHLLGSFDC